MRRAWVDIGCSTIVGAGAFSFFARKKGFSITDVVFADNWITSPAFWICAFILSWPYLMYAFIWYRPKRWMAMTSPSVKDKTSNGENAVAVFSTMCLALKAVQFGALICWWLHAHRRSIFELGYFVESVRESAVHDGTLVAVALIFICVSQILNLAIYYQIGNDGVYYGFKLQRPVPWCTGFPFNVGLRHPQYVGVVFGIWGCGCLMITGKAVEGGLFSVLLAWCVMYLLVSRMEETGSESKSGKSG